MEALITIDWSDSHLKMVVQLYLMVYNPARIVFDNTMETVIAIRSVGLTPKNGEIQLYLMMDNPPSYYNGRT